MNTLRIKSSNSDTAIEFAERKGDYFRVSILGRAHSATRDVYAYTDADGLARLFTEAAHDWKGWKEPKIWESLEGELRGALTHDGKGEVTLKVDINADQGGTDPWRHHAALSIDAGQLETIAGDASQFWAVVSERGDG